MIDVTNGTGRATSTGLVIVSSFRRFFFLSVSSHSSPRSDNFGLGFYFRVLDFVPTEPYSPVSV